MAARRLLPVVAVAAGVAAACSTSYDAGDTAEEQLCDVLRTAIETSDAGEDLRLEPLLDAAATDPTEVPTELLAVALSYRTHESAYDQLGPYRPAITFTAHLVDLAVGDLLGPSRLTATVVDSALAADQVLAAGTCRP